MKRWPIAVGVLLIVAAGAWAWGSPYWTVSRLKQAADARDVATLSAHVDYPAVRESLKLQLRERLGRTRSSDDPLEALGAAVAERFAAPVVDALVTPEGVRVIFATGAGASANRPGTLGVKADAMTLRRDGLGQFSLVQREGGGALVFRLQGLRWMLTDIRVPADARP